MKDNIQIVVRAIIHYQEMVLGPLAMDQAKKVHGIHIGASGEITAVFKSGYEKKLLAELVSKYESLFGQASVEVCKDAVREEIPDFPEDILPDILK